MAKYAAYFAARNMHGNNYGYAIEFFQMRIAVNFPEKGKIDSYEIDHYYHYYPDFPCVFAMNDE